MARPPQTVSNMVRSMLVVIVGVALIVIATLVKDAPKAEVEYRSTWIAAQREVKEFTPLAPQTLPSGWSVNSVDFTREPLAWRLSFTTASGRYAAIEQGPDRLVWLKTARADGRWGDWERWNARDWRALTNSEVVLCGDAPFEELEELASSLSG